MALRHAFSPAGGLAYHLIARRRARTLWLTFRAQVRTWLATWFSSLHARELIVFGPSAGWTLPLDEFARFTQVVFVEPDPVARFLLRRRLPASVKSTFIARADLLPWTSKRAGTFAEFLGAHPSAAVLFTNVLGQMALVSPRARTAGSEATLLRDEFLAALREREWASYHDLYSGPSEGAQARASRNPLEVFAAGTTVIDHDTTWLAGGRTPQVALWPLTEDSIHIIDFVSSVKNS